MHKYAHLLQAQGFIEAIKEAARIQRLEPDSFANAVDRIVRMPGPKKSPHVFTHTHYPLEESKPIKQLQQAQHRIPQVRTHTIEDIN